MAETTNQLSNKLNSHWEPELLISGGLIYTLLQAPDWLVEAKVYIESVPWYGQNTQFILVAFGISTLTLTFGIHLFLKSLWVALLAAKRISSNPDSLDHCISKVDKMSSLLFSLSFLLILIFGGTFIYSMVIAFIVYLIKPGFHFLILAFLMYLPIITLLGDAILGGRLTDVSKNILVRVLSFVSFYFTYNILYKSILKRYSTLRVTLFLIPFLIISFFLAYRNTAKILLRPQQFESFEFLEARGALWKSSNNYDDERRREQRIIRASLPSYTINNTSLQVFLRYDGRLDESLSQLNQSTKNKKEVLNTFFTFAIDDKAYKVQDWMFTKDPVASQYGLLAIIDIDSVKTGVHKIDISINQNYSKEPYWAIPFIKEN